MSKRDLEKLHIGTSGWSYPDWVGPFYPEGTVPAAYLRHYADHFPVVEVDATFYAIPAARTVENWARNTDDGFRFALKVPGTITHGVGGTHGGRGGKPDVNKVLADEEGDLETFLQALEPLGEKLGPLIFQFPYFRVKEMAAGDFLERLARTLDKLPAGVRCAVEIRNKTWITPTYLDLLRAHEAAAVMIDHPYMPLPHQQLRLGMVTADFAYVRLLGDRHAIEKKSKRWGEIVEDKSRRVEAWAEVLREIVSRPGVARAFAFSNNHFAGHGPATSRQLLARVSHQTP